MNFKLSEAADLKKSIVQMFEHSSFMTMPSDSAIAQVPWTLHTPDLKLGD
jgi:hypothetical protein